MADFQCSCQDCTKQAVCRFDGVWYCNKHYLRMRAHGSTDVPIRKKTCSVDFFNDGTSTITTAKGNVILIDTDDAEKVMRYSWCISKTGYAVANNGKRVIKMHRFILGLVDDAELVIDHINGNRLDNRKANLRVCTSQENGRNLKRKASNTSGEAGIRITDHGRYNVRITYKRKEIHIGNFATMDEAIVARKRAEEKYFGEFSPTKSRQEEKTNA